MKVVYLVNQYPRSSHTFIRTEIELLEARGFHIERVTVNEADGELVDDRDKRERKLTRLALKGSYMSLLLRTSIAAMTRPKRLFRALGKALQMAGRAPTGVLQHLGYVAEACVLLAHCKRLKIEHVHAHFGTNSTAIAYLTRILGGPTYSFTVHGTETFDTPAFLWLSDKIGQATFVAAVSSHGRALLQRWTPEALWPKIHLIRCVPDSTFFGARPVTTPRALRLVCVARLSAEKGILTLIDAAGVLQREGLDFEVEIVGDGPLKHEAEERARSVGVDRRLRFVGWRTGVEVRDAIHAARAFVQPSYAEGLPVATMEALVLRRPVISTYVGGVPELVRPGESGWLVPAGSVVALADAMREVLLARPEELDRRGQLGRDRVLALHSPEEHIEHLARCLRGQLELETARDNLGAGPWDGGPVAQARPARRAEA